MDGNVSDRQLRTASTCYMNGFSENLRVSTSSALPWFHRRICFTLKGVNTFNQQLNSDNSTIGIEYRPWVASSNGMQRLWLNQEINTMPNTMRASWELMFAGTLDEDWNDLIAAPLDTSRVSVKFDKTWILQSGNERGIVRERKLWHPMKKNLVYADEESGNEMKTSFISTTAKPGMGDYYIVDIIQPGTGGVAGDRIELQANSALYWAEK